MEETDTRIAGIVASNAKKLEDIDSLRSYLQENPHIISDADVYWKDHTPNNGTVAKRKATKSCHHKSHNSDSWSRILIALRICFVDVPLAIVFGLFVCVYCFRQISIEYFDPFFKAAKCTDERLMNEHTYYERECSVADVSTNDLRELVLDANNSTPEDAEKLMMVHGAAVFPGILSPSTIKDMRKLVVHRNGEIHQKGEAYPVSQGSHRSSFGIDATEDPIVPVALKEIATHPLVGASLERLLGPDPAVTEITAITAYYECDSQEWHSDTKTEGNAMKYARTFAHSYSLFIPLQDTPSAMGATEICPGTHYCADEWLGDMCDQYGGQQLNEASQDNVWHSGDGALLNQHMWHRGYQHQQKGAEERIVFIVSFISRPRLGIDHRQLSRGTYFHLKWSMWGHTFKDFIDAGRYMRWPFNLLRCLRVWKVSSRNWGYDLITSSVMRIANNQGGMEPDDLPIFVEKVTNYGIDPLLQGPVFQSEGAWETYISRTIQNCYIFMAGLNGFLLIVYFIVICILVDSGAFTRNILPRAMFRLLLTHGAMSLLGYLLLVKISHSPWGINIQSGKTLMLPFSEPVIDKGISPGITGLTTLPETLDVLVGTRFDSRYIGAYNQWLDYHPGNVQFRQVIAQNSQIFASYSNAGNTLSEEFVGMFLDAVVDGIHHVGGRFLFQNYENGDWEVMSNADIREHTQLALLSKSNVLRTNLCREIAFLIADYRFGYHRGTQLSRDSQVQLLKWRNVVLGRSVLSAPARTQSKSRSVWSTVSPRAKEPTLITGLNVKFGRLPSEAANPYGLAVGGYAQVYYDSDSVHHKSIITRISDNGESFDAESRTKEQIQTIENYPSVHSVKYAPLVEGVKIDAAFKDTEEYFRGRVTRVYPSGDIDVQFDDGDFESHIPMENWNFPFGHYTDFDL